MIMIRSQAEQSCGTYIGDSPSCPDPRNEAIAKHLGFDVASTGSWYHQSSLGERTRSARFIHFVPIKIPRTRSACIRLDRHVSRVQCGPCNPKSPKEVYGISETVRIVTRLVRVSEIININHLLRSASAVALKSSVDTC